MSEETSPARVSDLVVGDVVDGPYGGRVAALDRYGVMISITLQRDDGRTARLTWPPDATIRLVIDP